MNSQTIFLSGYSSLVRLTIFGRPDWLTDELLDVSVPESIYATLEPGAKGEEIFSPMAAEVVRTFVRGLIKCGFRFQTYRIFQAKEEADPDHLTSEAVFEMVCDDIDASLKSPERWKMIVQIAAFPPIRKAV